MFPVRGLPGRGFSLITKLIAALIARLRLQLCGYGHILPGHPRLVFRPKQTAERPLRHKWLDRPPTLSSLTDTNYMADDELELAFFRASKHA